jgi:hypothetical protein
MWRHKLPNKSLTATSPQMSVQYAVTIQRVDGQNSYGSVQCRQTNWLLALKAARKGGGERREKWKTPVPTGSQGLQRR